MFRIYAIVFSFIGLTSISFGQSNVAASNFASEGQGLLIASTVAPAVYNDAQLDALIAGTDPDETTKISPWNKEFTLQLLAGYNDNVLQGAFEKESSPYLGASLEGFLWRTADDGRKDSYWYFLAEQIHYPSAQGVDTENLALLQTRKTWNPGQTLSGGYKFTFTYANEVFDISRSDLEIESTTLKFEQFDFAPFLRKNLSPQSYLQLEGGAERNFFSDSSDDYTDPYARLFYQRKFSFGGELELSYKTGRKIYDQRTQRDEEGFAIEETELNWQWHEASLKWKQAWLNENRLQTETKFTVKLNRDNGTGYSDYDRYKISQKVRLEKNSWSLMGEFNYSFNHYSVQTVDFSDNNLYQRNDLSALVRVDKKVSEKMKIFAEWAREESRSNRFEDTFRQNVIYLGFERIF